MGLYSIDKIKGRGIFDIVLMIENLLRSLMRRKGYIKIFVIYFLIWYLGDR